MFVLGSKKKDKRDKFVLAFTEFIKKSICHYADIVDNIAEIQKKFPENYDDFVDFQKSPSSFLDIFDKIDEKEAKTVFLLVRLLKLIIKTATIEQKVRNIIHLNYKQKKELATELRSIVNEIEREMEQMEEEIELKEGE